MLWLVFLDPDNYRDGTSCDYGPNKPLTKVETPVAKILEII